ncbi:MAG: ABC transporter substrate-binding protein [Rhodobacteraceae bacterium]|nr:ABC transporter substrate-binding protein [Paracoccaceae bacterium]
MNFNLNPGMTRRGLLSTLSAALIALPMLGGDVAAQAKSGGTLTVARPADVSSMNVYNHATIEDEIVHPMVFDTLVYGANNAEGYGPGLAESWTFDAAANAYTFKLRDNAKFADGSALTAADVVFSINESKEKSANYKGLIAGVTGVEAVGDHSVKVTLAGVDNLFLAGLTWVYIVPNNYGGMSADDFFAKPNASGPFTMAEWTPGSSMTLAKNPNYWNTGKPYLDAVEMKIISGDNERLAAFQSGGIDLYENVRFDFMGQVPASNQHIVNPTARTMLLYSNNYKPPFDNIEVRKALSMAINRDAIQKALWPNLSVPVQGLLMPGTADTVPATNGTWDYDPEAAKAALAGSPTPNAKIRLAAAYLRGVDEVLVQTIQSQLQEAGFEVELNISDFNTILGQVLNNDFDVWLLGNTTFGTTAAEMFNFYASAFGPLGGWDLPKIGADLAEYRTATDKAGREEAVRKFENLMRETYAASPVGHPATVFGVADGVKGLETMVTSAYRLDQVWLDR